jgi:formylglycine-generating enzyme required for sulfatase activity
MADDAEDERLAIRDAARPVSPPLSGRGPSFSPPTAGVAPVAAPPRQSALKADPQRPASPAPFDLPGYRFEAKLGQGGMGDVYLGFQTSINRPVAIKVLSEARCPASIQAEVRKRFHLEAEVLGRIQHPNVVRVIDLGVSTDGQSYMVMEYIAGVEFGSWLADRWRFPENGKAGEANDDESLAPVDPDEPLGMFVTLCKAVDAAHVLGIAHRDLKPSNVMIDARGQLHVLDFGLAQVRSTVEAGSRLSGASSILTQPGRVMCTPEYASPEQAGFETAATDVRTDVYSLGVILYQILTGGLFPYDLGGAEKGFWGKLDTVRRVPPTRPSVARANAPTGGPEWAARLPAVNPAIEAVVLKALSKAPADRHPNAGDMARDVEAYLLAGGSTLADTVLDELGRAADGQRNVPRGTDWVTTVTQTPKGNVIRRRRPKRSAAIRVATAMVLVAVLGALAYGVITLIRVSDPPRPAVVAAPRQLFNSIGMKLVLIEPGTFDMGSPTDEAGREANEVRHSVKITRPFYLAATEVTQREWLTVMGATANRSSFVGLDLPVEQVSWEDANLFCLNLSLLAGRPYRLPSEAEWEYACRAGNASPFSTGWTLDTNLANYDPRGGRDPGPTQHYRAQTVPVGGFPPNPWGLYDMHGNVWEWCDDRYGEYPPGPQSDPKGVREGDKRVLRGGSWFINPIGCRSAIRGGLPSTFRRNDIGFRVASDVR